MGLLAVAYGELPSLCTLVYVSSVPFLEPPPPSHYLKAGIPHVVPRAGK